MSAKNPSALHTTQNGITDNEGVDYASDWTEIALWSV